MTKVPRIYPKMHLFLLAMDISGQKAKVSRDAFSGFIMPTSGMTAAVKIHPG